MVEKENILIQAEKLSTNDTLYDRIRKYYLSPETFPLTESEKNIHDRWLFAFNQMLARFKDAEIANLIYHKFSVSKVQAYLDIKQTKLLFGEVLENNDKLSKYLRLQSAIELERVARSKNDLKHWAIALKIQNEISPAKDFDDELLKKIQKADVHIHLDTHSTKIMEMMTKSGVINFNDLPTEDIEFTEIENDQNT